MAKLLTTLEQPAKKPFQMYVIEHGIERISVKVPLSEAPEFEKRFAASNKSKDTITGLLHELGGSVVGGH